MEVWYSRNNLIVYWTGCLKTKLSPRPYFEERNGSNSKSKHKFWSTDFKHCPLQPKIRSNLIFHSLCSRLWLNWRYKKYFECFWIMYLVTSEKGNEFEKWLPTAFILQIKYYNAEKLNTAFDNFRVVDILFRNDSKTISCAKTHNEIGYLNFERIILKPNFYCAFKMK